MSLTLRRPNYVVEDPFAVARSLLGWDPFRGSRQPDTFAPSFEVKETQAAFEMRADLPGVDEKDIDVSLHNGTLTVTATRHGETKKEGESYLIYERQFGTFSRSFVLPETADGERIEAKLAHGVLTLSIAKKAEAKPRKIAFKKE